MAQSKMPRRPVIFDAARADAIIGDEDPAASAVVVHTAVRVLMGVGDETFTDADVARLRETVRTSGVDMIVYVWSCSPELTPPGALWRVYLLHEWYHRDPLLMAERYTEGSHAPIIQGLETPVELRPLSLIMKEVDSLLHGDLTDDDLEHVLGEVSRAMCVFAIGEARTLWIEGPADPFVHCVTICHFMLLVTADELDVAACEAVVGTFD